MRPPRRVSGPVGGRAAPAGAPGRTAAAPREARALGERALAVVRGLPDHSLIDRLVRGRAWIPVLGVLLVGLVAMQVEILKLGTSMGRAMEKSSALQTENESLQASVAGLADDQRIERLAVAMGMSMASPDSLVFASAHARGDVARALANIHAPDPAGFTSQLAAQAAAAAALSPATSGTTPATGVATTGPGTAPTAAGTASGPATTAAAGSPTSPASTGGSPASGPTGTVAAPATGLAGSSGAPGSGTGSGGGTASTGAAGIAPVASSQPAAP